MKRKQVIEPEWIAGLIEDLKAGRYNRPPLTVMQAAAVLSSSESTVRGLVDAGHLRALRLPGAAKVLVEVEALADYLERARGACAAAK